MVHYNSSRKIDLCILIITFLMWPSIGSSKEPLNLDQIIQKSTLNNPLFKSLKSEVEVSKSQLSISKLKGRPNLSLEAGSHIEENDTVKESFSTQSIKVDYALFEPGRSQEVSLQQNSLQEAELEMSMKQRNLKLQVYNDYYMYNYYRGFIGFLQEFKKRSNEQSTLIRRLIKVGKSAQSDLMKHELQLIQTESELLSLQNQLQLYKLKLAQWMQLSVNEFEVQGQLLHFHLDENQSQKLLQSNNLPSTQLMNLKMSAQDIRLTQAQRRYWPKVHLEAEYGQLDPDFSIEEGEPQLEAGVMLTWDLNNSLKAYHKKQMALSNMRKVKLLKRHQHRQTMNSIQSLIEALTTLQKRGDVEADRSSKAQKLYSLTKKEFKRGVRSSDDLASSSEELFKAQINDLEFRKEFLVKSLELEKLVGQKVKLQKH